MGLNRRDFLLHSLIAALSPIGTVHAESALKIGLTPVILDDQLGFLRKWGRWLENQLLIPVQFVQRLKYRDITESLLGEQLDAAWVCGFPYVRHREFMQLLAVPLYKGKPSYHSYIITRRDLKTIDHLRQLQGRVFAYSDPDSNSGYLYPRYRFLKLGIEPRLFFRRHFFTWAHRNTIDAVANGLADAGAVDSYVWEQYRRQNPDLVNRTRIIERSPAFGFPPLVGAVGLPVQRREQLSRVLLDMHNDSDGKSLLDELGLDGFVKGDETQFASIAAMWRWVNEQLTETR